MKWKKVLCTHEEKQVLARGPWLGDEFPGVALPSALALGKWVVLRYQEKWTVAQCVDIGPWCHDDSNYVFDGTIPRAEQFKGMACPTTHLGPAVATVPDGKGGFKPAPICNGAAIDIFPRVAKELGIKLNDNVTLEWAFVDAPDTIPPSV